MNEIIPVVWIENTTSKFDHGGSGWEFGRCVWSPARDKRGSEGRYRIIREVKAGDLIVNCYDGVISGTSRASTDSYVTPEKPPNPGDWGYASSYCRFDLVDFVEVQNKVSLRSLADQFKDQISNEIEVSRPSYYLFSWWPRSQWYPEGRVVVSQGRFLARATPKLCRMIDLLVNLEKAMFSGFLQKE